MDVPASSGLLAVGSVCVLSLSADVVLTVFGDLDPIDS